jgi:hypothetical protein
MQLEGTMLKDHGQIDEMSLPDSWFEGEPEPYTTLGTRSYRWVHPPDVHDVRINFFYRGLSIAPESAEAFRNLLQRPAQSSLTWQDLAPIAEILRDMANPEDFALANASTERVNGKMVLVVRGKYRVIEHDTFEIFVDADGTGRYIQEIFFKGPSDSFHRFFSTAQKSLRSIRWKLESEFTETVQNQAAKALPDFASCWVRMNH